MASSKDNNEGFIPLHSGYRNLITYQKAEIIYDGTVYSRQDFKKTTAPSYQTALGKLQTVAITYPLSK